jgi:hypothetical protein
MTARQTIVRLIPHTESYEVRVSTYFYHDDNPGRRSINGRPAPEEALAAAQALAREQQTITERKQ